jgi:hypothetical protein
VRAEGSALIELPGGTTLTLGDRVRVDLTSYDEELTKLTLATDIGGFELDDSLAHIQVSETGAEVRVREGQVVVSSDQGTNRVKEGQVAVLGTGIRPDERIVASTSLSTATQSPPPSTTAVSSQTRTPRTNTVAMPLIQGGASPTPSPAPPTATLLRPAPTATPMTPVPTATLRPAMAVRVNCGGGDYTDSKGHKWAADKPYQAGSWGFTGGKIYTTGNEIANTEDDLIYQSERWGDFFYLFDMPSDTYRVTFYLAELYRDDPGARSFDIVMEGERRALGIDVVAQVGRDAAYIETHTIELTDGQLGIEFKPLNDHPKINGIEIETVR